MRQHKNQKFWHQYCGFTAQCSQKCSTKLDLLFLCFTLNYQWHLKKIIIILISDCSSFWICRLVTVTDSLSGQQMAAQPWPLENSLQQRAPLLSNVMPQMASRVRNIQTFEWFVNDRFPLRKQLGSFLMCNFQLNRYIFMIPI